LFAIKAAAAASVSQTAATSGAALRLHSRPAHDCQDGHLPGNHRFGYRETATILGYGVLKNLKNLNFSSSYSRCILHYC
jgi:hypothetical protein